MTACLSTTPDTITLNSPLLKGSFEVSPELYQYLRDYYANEDVKVECRRRSHIFVPLNKPRFKEKIGNGEVAADGFIWDLEDSIPMGQKQAARETIKDIPPKPGNVEYCLRINMAEPELLEKDIKAASSFPFDSITLPKGESGDQIARLGYLQLESLCPSLCRKKCSGSSGSLYAGRAISFTHLRRGRQYHCLDVERSRCSI